VFPKPPTLQTGDHQLEKPAAFGEFSMLEVLGDRVGFVRAWQSLAGWRGDTIVPFSRNKRDCVALVTQFDRPEQASAFADVANQWADGASGAAVLQQGASVQLEACDPGANHESPAAVTPSALDVLEARAAVINAAASQPGADRLLAHCAIDRAIAQLGAQQFMDAVQSDVVSPAARQAVASGAAACRETGG
jgi:hypothetical protein